MHIKIFSNAHTSSNLLWVSHQCDTHLDDDIAPLNPEILPLEWGETKVKVVTHLPSFCGYNSNH